MIKEINSKDNRILKECQRLTQKKYRDKESRYLIEGHNLLEEAINDRVPIDYLIFDEEKALNTNFDGDSYIVKHSLFERIAQTETSQGVIAVVRKREYGFEELTARCQGGSNIVVLDRLQDPGNIGTIIRTAEGAGYAAVFALKGTADIFSPKTIRAAAGSVFRIPIIHVEDNRELKALAGDLHKKLVVTSLEADNNYFDADLCKDIALVIGNEGNGVSEELLEMADVKIRIPMAGRLESLNASVAAGILMYEAQRCKKKINKQHLSEVTIKCKRN